jgi:hypothetical protein
MSTVARVFNIRLEDAANTPGLDGYFTAGPLAGKSVNIKLYGKRDRGGGCRPTRCGKSLVAQKVTGLTPHPTSAPGPTARL